MTYVAKLLIVLLAFPAYLTFAHDIYELLEDQKGLVTDLSSLTEIVHNFQDH